MKVSDTTKDYIKALVSNAEYDYLDDATMEEIYKIGAYHGAFSEQNFGEDDRRNSVYGFLETLVGLVK